MKHKDLIRTLESMGCVLARNGGKHDIYRNPITGVTQPVPRHTEISDYIAKTIIRKLETPHAEDDKQ